MRREPPNFACRGQAAGRVQVSSTPSLPPGKSHLWQGRYQPRDFPATLGKARGGSPRNPAPQRASPGSAAAARCGVAGLRHRAERRSCFSTRNSSALRDPTGRRHPLPAPARAGAAPPRARRRRRGAALHGSPRGAPRAGRGRAGGRGAPLRRRGRRW